MAVRAVTGPPAPLVPLGCFLDQANRMLRRRVRTGAEVAVVVAGVAQITQVPGTACGPAADDVLRAVAGWVLDAPGPAAAATPMGDGEFAVLCEGIHDSGEIDTIVRRIRDAMTRHFGAGGALVPVGTATGVAMACSAEDTAEMLITTAARAMRAARWWGGASAAVPACSAAPASPVPGTPAAHGDDDAQAASPRQPPPAFSTTMRSGMELADAVVHRLFAVGAVLEATAGLADGTVAAGVQQALDELDAIIRDARTAAFGVRFPPGTDGKAGARADRLRAAARG